jgi:hypothetical protein
VTRAKGDSDSGSGLFPVALFRRPRRAIRKESARPAARLADRASALDSTRPLFIVHKPYQYHDELPRLLERLQADAGDNVALGVSSWLPSGAARSHWEFNSACEAADVRIVDPRGYLADRQDLRVKKPSTRAAEHAPYLRDEAFPIARLLDAQRESGANLLLTSGRALNPSAALRSLAEACDEGDEALSALKAGERLALNLTLSAEWLRLPDLLDDLLNELIEKRQFRIWHIRVQWPPPAKSWHQPVDEDLLAGYRALAETARNEERRLLLPQTGLTGWLTLAWGTAGFGTGLNGAGQAFLEEDDDSGPRKNSTIERYFERQLLHFAERTARPELTKDEKAYVKCACQYCGPLLAGPAWSKRHAGLHYVHNVAMLTAAVAPLGATPHEVHKAVASMVRAAALFAAGKRLTGQSAPAHLRTWDRVL